MRIGHNLMAANAIRNTNANAATAGKSMEKLSSGLAITNAADNAAGLAVSEKMKGQIRGLDQASKNAQDGVSLLQTADGALNETTSILQRMRELANQASNDTNTTQDRQAIQTETNQLVSQLDNIANTTQFNTKNLLNGGCSVSGTVGTNLVGVTITGGNGDTKVASTITLTAAKAATAATAVNAGAFTGSQVTGALGFTVNGSKFNFAANTSTQDVLDAINSANIGVTATATNSGVDLTLTQNQVGLAPSITTSLATGTGTSFAATTAGADASITGATFTAQGNNVTITSGGAKGLELNIADGTNLAALAANNSITVDTNGSLALQIGANQGQAMGITINDMRAAAIGVSALDMTTATGAQAAIKAIDTATATVSSERSKLGAYQNRLESTINNLGTTSENLTSAQSSVSDVDMAKEMAEYSKNNILSQASQAMLAQANQQPQQVLKLLQ